MLDATLDQIDPIIANALLTLILGSLGGMGWIGIVLRQVMTSKKAKEDLHDALESGVDWVTDQIAHMATGDFKAPSRAQIEEQVLDYVKGSVPDALKKLRKQATPEQLTRMARGRINNRLMSFGVIIPGAGTKH